jgi:hypothetical protein
MARKSCGKAQMSTKSPLCQEKTEGGLEKGLANRRSRKKFTKKAHAGRGQETKWEMSGRVSESGRRVEIALLITLARSADFPVLS